jgi:hypothetical protein
MCWMTWRAVLMREALVRAFMRALHLLWLWIDLNLCKFPPVAFSCAISRWNYILFDKYITSAVMTPPRQQRRLVGLGDVMFYLSAPVYGYMLFGSSRYLVVVIQNYGKNRWVQKRTGAALVGNGNGGVVAHPANHNVDGNIERLLQRVRCAARSQTIKNRH